MWCKTQFKPLFWLIAMLATLPGCASRPNSCKPPVTIPHVSVIGFSIEHRPVETIAMGSGSARILLIASIHGTEPAGTPLLHRALRELALMPDLLGAATIVLVPNANPDGLANHRRHNVRGVDLNRNFPSASFRERRRHGPAPLSEPESHALHNLIQDFQPHAIISIHQPLACIDYDGPAEDLAHVMAEASNLPVRKLGALPGSLGSFAGEDLGIPTITLELPGDATSLDSDLLWQRCGPMLIAAIRHVAANQMASDSDEPTSSPSD